MERQRHADAEIVMPYQRLHARIAFGEDSSDDSTREAYVRWR